MILQRHRALRLTADLLLHVKRHIQMVRKSGLLQLILICPAFGRLLFASRQWGSTGGFTGSHKEITLPIAVSEGLRALACDTGVATICFGVEFATTTSIKIYSSQPTWSQTAQYIAIAKAWYNIQQWGITGTDSNKGSITFPIAAKAKSLFTSDFNGGNIASLDYPYTVTIVTQTLTDSGVQYIVYHEGIGAFYWFGIFANWYANYRLLSL